MNRGLTKREKIMLYALLCFLILAGGVFLLVLPAGESYLAAQRAYTDAEADYMMTKVKIEGIPDTLRLIDEDIEKLKEFDDYFYEPMTNERMDMLITGMIREHNLIPVSLSLSDVTEMPLKNYSAQSEEESKSQLNILTGVATAQVQGDKADVVALADSISKLTSMTVTNLQIAESPTPEAIGAESVTPGYSLSFNVYMVLPVSLEEQSNASE